MVNSNTTNLSTSSTIPSDSSSSTPSELTQDEPIGPVDNNHPSIHSEDHQHLPISLASASLLPPPSHPDHHPLGFQSPSSTFDSHGSPRSILSWNNLADLLSISDSSQHGGSTAESLQSDDHLSDLELNPPAMAINQHSIPDQEPRHPHQLGHHQAHYSHQSGNPELLTAITRHLVMPRLPMIPTPSAHSSRPSSLRGRSSRADSSSSLHHSLEFSTSSHHHPHINHLSDPSPSRSQIRPSSSPHKPRVLVLGDAQTAHGLGSLDSQFSSFRCQVDRIHDSLPPFRFSDPSTYPGLIEFIEGPLNRLKEILNPMVWNTYDQTSYSSTTQDDLMNLLDCWIQREGYLLLLVEIESFPLPPDKLEFVLSLSRLLPIVPYIPGHVPQPRAIDGHAILTRQFSAKRIQHFPIPQPESSSQPVMTTFPGRDECLFRSSRCAFDWLAIEYASRIDHQGRLRMARHEEEAFLRKPQHSWKLYEFDRKLEDVEPDRWSEKVSQRITRRTKAAAPGMNRRPSAEDPLTAQRHGHFPTTPTINPRRQSCFSVEALGLPSLGALIRFGIQQLKRRLIEAVTMNLSRSRWVALSDHDDNSTQLTVHSLTSLKDHKHDPSSHQAALRPEDSSRRTGSLLDRFDRSIHQPSVFLYPPHPADPRPSTSAAWFMIGFVTATTAAAAAALTVWWRSGLIL